MAKATASVLAIERNFPTASVSKNQSVSTLLTQCPTVKSWFALSSGNSKSTGMAV